MLNFKSIVFFSKKNLAVKLHISKKFAFDTLSKDNNRYYFNKFI